MEMVVLTGIIIFLIFFIVFKELVAYKERDILTKKLMAKSFVDYSNVVLAETELKKASGKADSMIRM